MRTHPANVIVHLLGPIDGQRQSEIRDAVAAQPGVGRAATSGRAPRLILVDYDPDAVSVQQVLDTVHRRGVGASLVGM